MHVWHDLHWCSVLFSKIFTKSKVWLGQLTSAPVVSKLVQYTCPRSGDKLAGFLKNASVSSVCFKLTGRVWETMQKLSESSSLVYAHCLNGYCRSVKSNNEQQTVVFGQALFYVLGDRSSTSTLCSKHRKGLLCGQCVAGWAVTPASTVTAFHKKSSKHIRIILLRSSAFLVCETVMYSIAKLLSCSI